jgi:TorA maturation chaperone TorD
MLARVFLPKETNMSKQLPLFDPSILPWVRRLWDRIDPEKRQQVLVILAGMARSSLATNQSLKPKEATDESN